MLTKEIWIGSERGYVCKISRAVFGEKEHGGPEAARRAAVHHCCSIIKQQTADGILRCTSLRVRAKLYKKSMIVL